MRKVKKPMDRSQGRRRRILIVEDDYIAALQFANALAEAGFEVVDIASTAAEAIAFVPDHLPDLIVMDVRLAGPRDGIEAASEIFRCFGIQSIFVSGFLDPPTRARGLAANPFGWLSKPIQQAKLVATVNAALNQLGKASSIT